MSFSSCIIIEKISLNKKSNNNNFDIDFFRFRFFFHFLSKQRSSLPSSLLFLISFRFARFSLISIMWCFLFNFLNIRVEIEWYKMILVIHHKRLNENKNYNEKKIEDKTISNEEIYLVLLEEVKKLFSFPGNKPGKSSNLLFELKFTIRISSRFDILSSTTSCLKKCFFVEI